jgi:hypothetical protein
MKLVTFSKNKQQSLQELFDTPPPEINLISDEYGETVYHTKIGKENFIVVFNVRRKPLENYGYEIFFHTKNPCFLRYLGVDENAGFFYCEITFGVTTKDPKLGIIDDFHLTNTGNAATVISSIGHIIETYLFDHNNFSVILYSASSNEPSRVKAYKVLTYRFAKEFDAEYFIPDTPFNEFYKYYIFVEDQKHRGTIELNTVSKATPIDVPLLPKGVSYAVS